MLAKTRTLRESEARSMSKDILLRILLLAALTLLPRTTLAQTQPPIEELLSEVTALQQVATLESLQQAAVRVADWMEHKSREEIQALTDMQLVSLMKGLTFRELETPGGFLVSWTGSIRAPREGVYTFSVNPIDVNSVDRTASYRQSMVVTIKGQTVIDASPEGWRHVGDPIELAAGEQAPLEVSYRYGVEGTPSYLLKAPSALLYWEGPGISKRIVPADVLRVPDGSKNGLLATYRRLIDGSYERIGEAVESQVDHLWLEKHNFFTGHGDLQSTLADHFYARMSDPAYLARWEDGEGATPPEHCLIKRPSYASYLTAERRVEFLLLLAGREKSLRKLTPSAASAIYLRFRHGAEDAAIEFLGSWMQSNPDGNVMIAADWYAANRALYRNLAVQVSVQSSRHIEALFTEYLETSDGDCSLPAAYTLAYGRLMTGRMKEWLEYLDARLEDNELTGDRRVNWLLARAHAEQVRTGPPERHYYRPDVLWRGQEWIDEARLVAESEPIRYRAEIEKIGQHASAGRIKVASDQLEELAGTLIDASLITRAAKHEADLAQLTALRDERVARRPQRTREAYRRAIAEHLELAERRGDVATAEQLKPLLDREASDP
jgi:hypothetical protein